MLYHKSDHTFEVLGTPELFRGNTLLSTPEQRALVSSSSSSAAASASPSAATRSQGSPVVKASVFLNRKPTTSARWSLG